MKSHPVTKKKSTTTRTAPKRRAGKRGGKRRSEYPTIDASRGPVVLEDSYMPDGSDDDDT